MSINTLSDLRTQAEAAASINEIAPLILRIQNADLLYAIFLGSALNGDIISPEFQPMLEKMPANLRQLVRTKYSKSTV